MDGPVAVVRNDGPVAVIPVGLLEIKWMGLWPSSAMLVVVVVAWVVVAAVARSLGYDLRSLLSLSYLVGLTSVVMPIAGLAFVHALSHSTTPCFSRNASWYRSSLPFDRLLYLVSSGYFPFTSSPPLFWSR